MTTFTGTPAASADDAFRRTVGSYFTINGTAAGVGGGPGRYDNSIKGYGCGIRFPNVTIPQGSAISAAAITFTAREDLSGTGIRSRLRAQKADNPGQFSDATDFDSRILTSGSVDSSKITSSVAWDDIAPWTSGSTYQSPDIAAIIQEIVNRPGWVSGNAIVIFWDDFDLRMTVDTNYRLGKDYDAGSGAPSLGITYTAAPVAKTASDSGSGTDSASVVFTTPVSATDSGSGTDTAVTAVTSVVFSDPFTGTSATNLDTYDPNWTKHSSAGSGIAKISNANRVRPNGANADGTYHLPAVTAGADYDVIADLVVLSAGGGSVGLWGRLATSAVEGYCLIYDDGAFIGNGVLRLYRYGGSGTSQLGTYSCGVLSGTHSLKLEMRGTAIKAYLDGTVRISVTETSITAAGRAGLRMISDRFVGGDDSSGVHLDNFRIEQGPVTTVSASDSGTGTEGSGSIQTSTTVSASDSGTGTDTGALLSSITPTMSALTLKTSGTAALIQGRTDAGGHNRTPQGPGMVTLPNGNVFIAYADTVDLHSPAMKYRVLDSAGNEVVSETVLRWASGTELTSQNGYTDPATAWGIGDAWAAYIPETNEVCVQWVEATRGTSPQIYRFAKFADAGTLAFSGPTAAPVAIGMGFANNPTGLTPYAISPSPPVQRPDGSWIAAVYSFDDGPYDSSPREVCVRSTDNMRTWTIIGTIVAEGSAFCDETALVRLSGNTFIAVVRIDAPPFTYALSTTTDGGVTWSYRTIVLGAQPAATGNLVGTSGRPSLIKDSNGVLWLFARAMVGTSGPDNSYPIVFRSTGAHDGTTWTAPLDPYTMAPVVNGRTNQTTRGYQQEGAFCILPDGNVALSWSEEFYDHLAVPAATTVSHNLYYRVLTTSTLGSGSDSATGTDTGSVTVGVGAIAKTASDSGSSTDTASGVAVTYRRTAFDTGIGTDSAGGSGGTPTSTVTRPFYAPLDLSSVTAPLDINAVSAPLDMTLEV